MKIFSIWNIILGVDRVAHECGHSQVPELKLQQDQQPLQSALPLKDKYLVGIQTKADPGDTRRLLPAYTFNNR